MTTSASLNVPLFVTSNTLSDRGGRAHGQAGAEEGAHGAADGQAQVPEARAAAAGLRRALGRHRDEGPRGL